MKSRIFQLAPYAIAAVSLTLGGCASELNDYAHVTAVAVSDLDTKISAFSADSRRLNDYRQSNQIAQLQDANESAALVQGKIDSWTVADDKERLRLMVELRRVAEEAAASGDRAIAELALKDIKSPAELSKVAKLLESLAQDQDAYAQLEFLAKYIAEVKKDIDEQTKAKDAEDKAAPKGKQ